MKKNFSGWSFFDSKETSAVQEDEKIALAFARVFNSADGERVLSHLFNLTIGRALPPSATDHELRHLEGKRSLYFYIKTMIKHGSTT